MSAISSGTSTPSSSASSSASTIPEDFPFATCSDRRDVPAKSVRYQRLERALDLTSYTRQVESLLIRPIKIPASHSHSYGKKTFFPLRGIWPTEERRKERLSKMYTFGNVKGRELVRDLILDDSDSDEDAGQEMSQTELKSILKMHKLEKKLRMKTKGEGLANQYAYFSAGLLSTQDSYNDGSRSSRNKPVEVNASALSTLAAASLPSAPPPPAIVHPAAPHPDDAPEPLSVDANFPNSTIIPLPPLSH